MRDHVVNLLTVSICFLLIFVIAAIVSLFPFRVPPINSEEVTKIFTVSPVYFAPEPQERLTYVTSTLIIPFLCAGLYILLSRQIKKENIKTVKLLSAILSPLILYLLFYLAFLGLNLAPFRYLKPSGLIKHPWSTFVLNIFLLALWLGTYRYYKLGKQGGAFKRLENILYWGAGSIILLLVGLEAIFNDAEPYVPHIHFIAYFDSVVQVYLGKYLFSYVVPQYGFYAWFLNPIFQIIGLDVIKFTIVMGIFRIIVYGSFLILFYRILDSKLIAFLCFATIFFFTRMRVPIDILKDPYFQYNPHRMIFPVLLILFTWFYLHGKNPRTKKRLYITNSILAAISVLWNLDTGIMVIFSWVGLLIYQELIGYHKSKFLRTVLRIFRHAVTIAVIVGLVLGIFIASTYFNTGQTPRLTHSSDYVQLFYGLGYYMLPMMIIHPWNIIILIYLVGIYLSMRGLIASSQLQQESYLSTHNTSNSFLFITSIMGVGLFNYYVGRSHEYNLVATVWPAYILLAMYIERLIKRVLPVLLSRSFNWKIKLNIALRNSFQVILLFTLLYFLGSSPVSILGNLYPYIDLIQTRVALVQQGIPPWLLHDLDTIKATSAEDDPVFIVSDYAPELHLYTQHTRPINIAGFGEIILKSDVDEINSFLENPPANAKIYWDKNFYDTNPYYFDINPYNFSNLSPQKTYPSESILLFEEKK